MVFSGLYPIEGDDFPDLRDALDRLRLNDAALVYEPESSTALGFGFRCGFLGLLHMDIVRERLEREFDLALITTAPNVAYRVTLETGETIMVSNPSDLPPASSIQRIEEPYVAAMVLCPADYIGPVMELCQSRRGELYEVPIQAAIGAKVIARETITARRKDVLAKCYGGDVTRKRKLLERQKEGKRRMKQIGRVEVPQEAFVAALRTDENTAR
jgi:translation elongation factor EF-4